MKCFCAAALLGLAGSAIPLAAQSTLPPTPPTTQAPIAPIAATPTTTHGRRAYVTYNGGLLEVRADNSSLNVILRDISKVTGMTVPGGVADQRVFGNYGPAEPGTVVATLLDGTGVNLLLRESQGGIPASLVLTPQTGGPTPPSPDSHQFDEEAADTAPAAPPQSTLASLPVPPPSSSTVTTPPSAPQPWNNVNGSSSNTSPTASTLPTTNSVPIDSIPTPSTTPPSSGIVDAPNPPPAGTTANSASTTVTSVTTQPDGTTTTTTTTSPNGVKTPEQIYQQLLDMQKAKQAAAAPSQ